MQKDPHHFLFICLLVVWLFQGCATYSPTPPTPMPQKEPYPEPVIQKPQPPTPSPVQIATATPSKQSIGKKFIQDARKQVASGQYQKATATLERGLRLAPKDYRLWSELASLKLLQKNYMQAISLAKKSNTLAKGNTKIIQQNNSIISAATAKK